MLQLRAFLLVALSFVCALGFILSSFAPIASESLETLLQPFQHQDGEQEPHESAEPGLSPTHYEPDEPLKSKRDGTQYLLGVGKADITGPVVQINFAGYADSSQTGTGLRQRIHCRSFIIGSPTGPAERFVYLVLDTQSGDTAVRYGVLDGLAALGSDYAMYGQKNVALTGTHSHSGPGAWLNYLLPDITSLGFSYESYNAIVDGCVLSVQRAHQSLTLGTLGFGTVPLTNANANRSPNAYLANPASERAQYSADTDETLSMIMFTRASDGKAMGILNWFPVHGTSLYGNNTLVTGDNKGIAATMFEKTVQGTSGATDDFVAGFSQANVGDTTPNILGAYCEDGTNVMCSFNQSLCNGGAENCHGRGPNFTVPDNGATSGDTIGTRQYVAAKSLYDNWDTMNTPITGSAVRSFHTFQQMTGFSFTLPNGTEVSTCAGALGYGFGGGTTDWPGYFDFKQGDTSTSDANPLWLAVRAAIHQPSPQQIKCQGIKPILLDVGDIDTPYDWSPNIVDVQVLRVGQLFMIISPGEATTMSGRRWRNAIASAASAASLTGSTTPLVVLGGPANSYTHYIATEEEYQVQRYEGASTLFGPNTLNAYINLTTSYLPYLADTPPQQPLTPGPLPPNNVPNALSFILPVVFDTAPFGHSFGDVLTDAPSTASPGQTANATFVGANPRNDLRLESTYALVQRQVGSTWQDYKDDTDWELIFNWAITSTVLGTSSVTIEWIIPSGTAKGTYRLGYNGASKTPLTGTIVQFTGVSSAFTVT